MPVSERAVSRIVVLILLLCSLSGQVGTSVAAVRLTPQTQSVPLAPQITVLEDAGGVMTLADVQRRAADFKPSGVRDDAAINFGYSSSAWWLRIDLAADPDAARDWLLDIAFPTLDNIEYFGPGGEHRVAGDRLPFAARPLLHRNFVFPVRLDESGVGSIWLRVVSEGTLTIPVRLWRHEAFWQESLSSYAMLSVYFGMLLALAAYNLLLWFSLRDHNYLTYVLFAISMAVGQLSLNGLGNQFLWPDWPVWGNLAFSTGFATTGFFGALFTRGFLETRRNLPRLDGAIIGLAGLFALCAVAPLLAPYRLAAIMTSLTGVSFSLIAVVAGVRCWRAGQPGARVFILAWTALLLGVMVVGLRNLDLLPTTFLSFYAIQIGSAVEMVLLSFALAERINDLRREKDLHAARRSRPSRNWSPRCNAPRPTSSAGLQRAPGNWSRSMPNCARTSASCRRWPIPMPLPGSPTACCSTPAWNSRCSTRDAATARFALLLVILTISRRSTTAAAMPSATRCCGRSRGAPARRQFGEGVRSPRAAPAPARSARPRRRSGTPRWPWGAGR
jgi:hypothetical protein